MLRPIGQRVLVNLVQAESVSPLLLPFDRPAVRQAEVVSCGRFVRDLKPGMRVLVPALAGQKVGESILLREELVLGICD